MTLPNGYELISTFWQDFSIAEVFSTVAVRETFSRAFSDWKENHVFLTELVIVLNWKIWQHYQQNGSCELSRLYNELWEKADSFAMNNLKGAELDFFLKVTD